MPTPITNIEDLRVLARRRIPKALFEYVDGGSYDELTLRANRTDLDAIRLRQRVMVDTSKRDLATTLLHRDEISSSHASRSRWRSGFSLVNHRSASGRG